jgi:hypothetical protein
VTHKFVQYFILAVGALGLAALPAAADSPCSTADLNVYTVAGFSCYVGNLDFSNFSYTPGGTNQIASSSIGVSIENGPDGPGLNFDPAGNVSGSNLSTDVNVAFTVTGLDGTLISDIYMGFGNVTTSGTGTATYTENFCGGPEDSCSLWVEAPLTNDINMVNLSSTDLGGPVSSLAIDKDLDLETGANGSAATSSFLNEYSTSNLNIPSVPEPRAISLVLALGLLAGFSFFKRRQAAQVQ